MSLTGNWELTIAGPMGPMKGIVNLIEANGVLSGNQEGQGDVNDIFDGKFEGNKVTWKTSVTKPMPITLEFSGTLEGNKMSGEVNVGPMGSFPWEATIEGAAEADAGPRWKVQDFSKVDIGIVLNSMDFAPVPFAEQAIALEERGFESLWIPQHSHTTVTGPRNKRVTDEVAVIMAHLSDPFIMLATAAAVTKKIRIGTSVTLLAEYETFCFSHMAATLDHVSGGRLELGVGYGGNQLESENRGINFFDRLDIMDEKVEAIRELWGNEIASFDGKFHKFAPSRQWPKPKQKPYIPFLLGLVTDKRFDILCQKYEGWLPNIGTDSIDHVRGLVKSLEEAAERTGRDPKTINRTANRGFRSAFAKSASTHVELHRPVSRDEFKEMCVDQRDIDLFLELGLNRINVGVPFAPTRDEFMFMLDTLAEKLLK